MSEQSRIEQYYGKNIELEKARLIKNPIEKELTQKYIDKYISDDSYVIDLACGTGAYLEYLLKKSIHIGASDLTRDYITYCETQLGSWKNDRSKLLFLRQFDAREREAYNNRLWDLILLLGPVYHIETKEERRKLLITAKEHLSADGRLLVAFITRTAPIIWAINHNPEAILECESIDAFMLSGTGYNFAPTGIGLPNSYFCTFAEIHELLESVGLVIETLVGLEGVMGGQMERFSEFPPLIQEQWLRFIVDHCEEPDFLGLSEHVLAVARK